MKLSSRCLFWLTNALALMAVAVAMLHPNPAVAAEGTRLTTPCISIRAGEIGAQYGCDLSFMPSVKVSSRVCSSQS
jgi:hypothetical protein